MSTHDDIVSLTDRLKSLRWYMLSCRSAHGLMLAVTVFLAVLVSANLLHAVFYLPVWLRVLFVSISAVAILTAIYLYLLKPLIDSPSLETVTLQVEKKYPQLENRLIASLQLERNLSENRENYSTAMIRALISQTSGMVEGMDLKTSFSNNPLKRLVKYFASALAIALVLAILAPGLFQSSLHVFSHPLEEIEISRTFDIFVDPGTTEILKYDPFEVKVVVKGERLPKSAELFWDNSEEGGNWRSDDLERVFGPAMSANLGNPLGVFTDSIAFTYKFKEVKHSFRYFVRAGREESAEYDVTVVNKPRITGQKLTYSYPKYTRLGTVVVDENDGNIQALKGSRVELQLTANKPVDRGSLVFSDGTAAELKCDDSVSSASFRVMGNRSYHAELVDFSGYSNPHPIEYRITMLEDAYPEIYMVSPGGNVDLDDNMALTLMANLSDDFGFSKLLLNYTMHMTVAEQWDRTEQIPVAGSKTEQRVEYFWDLANIGMVPGSWIEYYLEAFDNDVISGPKSVRGPTLAVRLPSLDELFVDIESSREDQLEEYLESLKQQKQVGDEFNKLEQELKMERELDWERKQDLESVADMQMKLFEDFDDLAEQFQEVNDKARENNLLTLEMMQKMKELQKLFEEVATPEMKEAMRKLQEALSQMDKNEIERALDEFEMSLEDVLKNIERAIAQLKQLDIQQRMQDMIRLAEEILKNQQNVNSLTERSKTSDLPKAAPKEEQVGNSLENLKRKADDLKAKLPDANMDQNPNAQQFCSAPKESGAESDIEDMTASLAQEEKESAIQSGSSAESKLAAMIEKMKESQSAMSQTMGAEMAQKMRRALDDIFYLSDKQEELLEDVRTCQNESSELRRKAEEQQKLQKHSEWLNEYLFELSKESIFMQRQIDKLMSQCMSNMARSTSSLSEMSGQRSINSQQEAIYSLNQASRMIIESLNSQKECNNMCNNPNQSMCNKMGQMCKQQKRVNEQSQSMCNNPNLEGPGRQAALKRLAGEQGAIRKSIQELQNEFGDKRQIRGRLENLSEEMRRVVESLEQGGVSDGTLDRQRKIYQRMLDFQLSLERQDFSEERRAESSEQILRRGPDQLDTAARLGSESYEKRLQKFLQEGYPAEYEVLIKDYFKAIMEINE